MGLGRLGLLVFFAGVEEGRQVVVGREGAVADQREDLGAVAGFVGKVIRLCESDVRGGFDVAGVVAGLVFGESDGVVEFLGSPERDPLFVGAACVVMDEAADREPGLLGCRGFCLGSRRGG